MAVFLGKKGSPPSLDAVGLLPNDSEDHNQTGFHRIFYKYCAFLPDSTPTLSPTLYDREMALVAAYKNPQTGQDEIIGVGRLFKEQSTNNAEFAALVADQFQHRG